MHFKKRIYSVLIICALTGSALFASFTGILGLQGEESLFARNHKDTLYLWYTQSSLTDYLNAATSAYNENAKVRVEPHLASSTEFLEQINEASLRSDQVPDLFITTNDTLEKAYLAGLACEVPDKHGVLSTSFFPQGALNAITCSGKKVAYPLSFETSALLVNTSYLKEYATNLVLAETATEDASEGDGTQTENADETTAETKAQVTLTPEQEALIEERIQSFKPDTFENLETFADSYDAPEQVENIFKWDVTSVFYNYAFPGAYLSIGGECGDDASDLDLYNLNAIQALNAYQALNQFFFIETKNAEYSTVISEFIEGKTVFTIAGIDAVSAIEKAREEGTFTWDYEFLPLPAINDTLKTRPLSVSTVVAINGFSEHVKAADDFAAFLTCDYTGPLYTYTGRLSASWNAVNDYPAYEVFRKVYDSSVSMPKLMETGNFWIQMEIALSDIWNGADTNTTLKQVAETIYLQVTGEEEELPLIDVPVEEVTQETEEIEEVTEEGQP